MLESLKFDLLNKPCKSLLIAAKYVLGIWGDDRPDWVAALANGSPERWEAVIDVAIDDLEHDQGGVSHLKDGAL